MTDREVMQQALDFLMTRRMGAESVITALRTALEQQQAEPVAWNAGVAPMWPQQKEGETFSVAYTITTQPEQQAEPPPEWPLIKNILAEYGLDAISFVAEWKVAQRPWVGLTDEDWEQIHDRKDTSLDTFEQGAVWAAARLKERNT